MYIIEGAKVSQALIKQAMAQEGLTFGFESEFYFAGNLMNIYKNYMMQGHDAPPETGGRNTIVLGNARYHDIIRFFDPLNPDDDEDNIESIVNSLENTYREYGGEEDLSPSDMWASLRDIFDAYELISILSIFPQFGFDIEEDVNNAIRKVIANGDLDTASKLAKLENVPFRTYMEGDEDYEFDAAFNDARNLEVLFEIVARQFELYLGEPVSFEIQENKKKTKDKSRDYSRWVLTVDSSLIPEDDAPLIGFEMISPVKSGLEGYQALEKFLRALNDPSLMGLNNVQTVTNSTTGLHINIGFQGREIDYLKLLVLMGDKNIIEQFDRASNIYARSSYDRLVRSLGKGFGDLAGLIRQLEGSIQIKAEDMQGVLNSLKAMLSTQDRNFSVNLEKLPAGYIEFRSVGNKDYHKRVPEILGTVRHLMVMIMIATDPATYRQEYYKKIYKLLSNAAERFNATAQKEPLAASLGVSGLKLTH